MAGERHSKGVCVLDGLASLGLEGCGGVSGRSSSSMGTARPRNGRGVVAVKQARGRNEEYHSPQGEVWELSELCEGVDLGSAPAGCGIESGQLTPVPANDRLGMRALAPLHLGAAD
jgi:hypothetical protein